MGYVEQNLGKNEVVVKKADRNGLFLLGAWIKGILLFWLLLIPTIQAIAATITFSRVELAVTNKRIVGKVGVLKTKTLDAPLNKIQTVSIKQTFFGKIFNYSTVVVKTGGEDFVFDCIKSGDTFKRMVMSQIDQYEEDRIKLQASQMANAMAGAMKN